MKSLERRAVRGVLFFANSRSYRGLTASDFLLLNPVIFVDSPIQTYYFATSAGTGSRRFVDMSALSRI
jgi:hypothetical protein